MCVSTVVYTMLSTVALPSNWSKCSEYGDTSALSSHRKAGPALLAVLAITEASDTYFAEF